MPTVSTRECRDFVKMRCSFQTHGHLFAQHQHALDGTQLYVVFSYGDHWPLFVWHDGVWYENANSYSRTTSCHRNKAHPHCDTIKVPCRALKEFVQGGMNKHPAVSRLVAVSA